MDADEPESWAPWSGGLEVAELMITLPLSLWSAFQEGGPDYEGAITESDVDDVIVVGELLRPAGFHLALPVSRLTADHLAVEFQRGQDGIILTAFGGSVFVTFKNQLVIDVLEDNTATVGQFGGFPIHAVPNPFGTAMLRATQWFLDAVGSGLLEQPLPIADLRARCDEFASAQQRSVLERHLRDRAMDAWIARRHHAVVDNYERLDDLVGLDENERQQLETSRAMFEASMTDRLQGIDSLKAIATRVRVTHTALSDAFAHRGDPGGAAKWEDAAFSARAAIRQFEAYVTRIEDALKMNSPGSIDAAIKFLEEDPWCFRSGYAKSRILRRLRQKDLSGAETTRLVAIVLTYVDHGGRLEFRDATRLGRKLSGSDLRASLLARLHGRDTGVARRALFALLDLRRPHLSHTDVATARALILGQLRKHAESPNEWGHPRWPERLAIRFSSPEWIAALLKEIRDGGSDQYGALIVLSEHSRISAAEADRELLRQLLLAELRPGGSAHWIEGIARLVDSPKLRQQLEALVESNIEDVRWRAHWARNAIRRAHEES